MHLDRGKIIEAAAELFQKKGYTATSLRDIAEKTGFTKAALYYHIQNKEDILWEIIDRTMITAERRMRELMEQDMPVLERIRRIILNHILNVHDHTAYIAIFFTETSHLPPEKLSAINARRRSYEESIATVVRQGVAEGILKDMKVLQTVYGILGMCNWTYHWYNPQGPQTPVEIADLYARIILDGLAT
ncbi:MAG: TetR/AcrR family transcriptional regulator [Peptococcaceae bacterium]|jgi:AcrR family transcriptional regulator|nr:TetR/AcrR family transcriptional regulator [Peptococcaceae bacterium]